MKKRRDLLTPDLFAGLEPEPVVARFDEGEVRGWTKSRTLSRAIAVTLEEDGRSREVIAEELSNRIGERVSRAMLDNYASQEKEHAISAMRLVGLVAVTGDARPLNLLLGELGLIAIDAQYEALLRRELADEAIDRMTAVRDGADAEWKARRSRRVRR